MQRLVDVNEETKRLALLKQSKRYNNTCQTITKSALHILRATLVYRFQHSADLYLYMYLQNQDPQAPPIKKRKVSDSEDDVVMTASLKLLASLIKHYTKVIDEEKQTLKGTLKDVTTKIKHTKTKEERDTQATTWKALRQTAQDEAKKIGDDLKETRQKKLTQRKRKRERSQEDLIPQPKRSFVEALTGFMQEYATKKQTPKNGDGPPSGAGNSLSRGKGPANGRSYVKKTALSQPRH